MGITCPRCRHESPAGAKFCAECAAPLARVCPECGTRIAGPAKFCPECAHPLGASPAGAPAPAPSDYTPRHLAQKILTSRAALEGERKQVSVLFCDLVDSTALAEHLGPERMHGLLERFFEVALAEVHRYEGTVNQFLGDGFMALFGAPIAHEDHARRALEAALAIQRLLRRRRDDFGLPHSLGVVARMGLNSGPVVVGKIGDNLRMDYTAIGDTTHLAARLQQHAPPGAIVIAEPVHRLTAGFFHTRSLGALSVKGKTEPVSAWEVLGAQSARSRLDVEVERGLTPLLGRDHELAVLSDRFDKARHGHGQVVFLVGEPGIGKSRLLHELRQRLGDQAGWMEGRSVAFGRSIPFHPLIDLVRRRYGIDDEDAEPEVSDKLQRGVLSLGDDLSPTLPYLRSLLGLDPLNAAVAEMEPQERRAEMFHALRRLTVREAERVPQVIVFEDLHWADKATEDYLALLGDGVPASRLLLILTYRTGYVPPVGDRSYHTRIVPGALSADQTAQMAAGLMGSGPLPRTAETLLASKAAGNPFFVEELVKSLREVGSNQLDDVVVPDTVQDVIAARLDRLAAAPRRALQVAAAIGRRFTRRLLERILDESAAATGSALRELVALELIQETRVFPESEYAFRHPLTQDVAYGSLLAQHRRELHRRIAQTIEEIHGDHPGEQLEILAAHFEKAELWDRALPYLLRAADKAARAFATRDALALYDAAAATAERLAGAAAADAWMAIRRGRAQLYVVVSDFDRAREEWNAACELARHAGDRRAEGEALVAMGQASWLAHRFDQALEDSRRAAEVAEAIGATSVLAGSVLNEAIVYEVTGHLATARQRFDRALALSRETGDAVSEATALVFAAELESWEGQYARAAELYDAGIQLGRAHSALVPVLEGLFMAGVNATGQGAYDHALAMLNDGLALAERVGDENYIPRYLNSLGWLHGECGDLERARELNARAAEGGRKRGDHESFANAELNLGDIALARGELALARDLLEGVHGLVLDAATSQWMSWRYQIHLFASLGELALARGDLDAARRHADKCLERATLTRSRKYEVRGWRLRGEIATARRAWDDAQHALQEALALATAIGNPTQLWTTHRALGRLHAARGAPGAVEAYRTARTVVERLKTSVRDPELRTSLERMVIR